MTKGSGKPWLNARRMRAYPLIFLGIYALAAMVGLLTAHGHLDAAGRPLGTDFSQFYAASRLLLEGHAAQAWDPASLQAMEEAVAGDPYVPFYPWFYPPSFLLLVAPLALLPYGAALAVWLALTFGAYLAMMRRVLVRWPEGLWAAAAYPAVFVTATHGQNGFLSAALLGGGLLALERRPWVAGLLFGLLSVKPQLGLLLPVALLAGGHWRALIATGLAALGLAGLSAGLLGIDCWQAFLGHIHDAGQVAESGAAGFAKMQTVYAGLRLLRLSNGPAMLGQGLVSLAAAGLVAVAWRRPLPFGLKAALLCAGTLAAAPYGFEYDWMILAPAIAWLALEGCSPGLLAAAWATPLLSRMVGLTLGVPLGPVVLLAVLGMGARRIFPSSPRRRGPMVVPPNGFPPARE